MRAALGSRPFVTVNAAAIPETLLESEMFGHMRGRIHRSNAGAPRLLVEADGGTRLLNEIGDMPIGLQSKLLRVLKAGEIRAVGGDRVQRVDVRIVAATHRRLPDLVREGRFRDDLYYRLNVISITVPPLRSRAADIPRLAESFLERAKDAAKRARVRLGLDLRLLDLLGDGVRIDEATLGSRTQQLTVERREPDGYRNGRRVGARTVDSQRRVLRCNRAAFRGFHSARLDPCSRVARVFDSRRLHQFDVVLQGFRFAVTYEHGRRREAAR